MPRQSAPHKWQVLCNDGVGVQDLALLMEVVDVIDSSLPLIGRINAAKLVFAPDHQSLVLLRSTKSARRVLGAIVLKPHCARGFLEVRSPPVAAHLRSPPRRPAALLPGRRPCLVAPLSTTAVVFAGRLLRRA